jgi:hypothetical protein
MARHPGLLSLALAAHLACGPRALTIGEEDAGVPSSIADQAITPAGDLAPQAPDRGVVSADALATGTVWISVPQGKKPYTPFDEIPATVHNGLTQRIWLDLTCGTVDREHLEATGLWQIKGSHILCAAATAPQLLKPGQVVTVATRLDDLGTWRLRAPYDLCGLTGDCNGEMAVSSAIEIAADQAACDVLRAQHQEQLLSAQKCIPYLNAPQCLEMVAVDPYCSCSTYVNSVAPLTALARFNAWNCHPFYPACTFDCGKPQKLSCDDATGTCK